MDLLFIYFHEEIISEWFEIIFFQLCACMYIKLQSLYKVKHKAQENGGIISKMKTHLSAEFKHHASLYIYTSQIQRGISLKFSILCIVHQKHMTVDYMYQHSPSMWNLPMMAWYFLTPANGLPGAEFPPEEKVGMVTPTLVLPECFLEFPLSAMLSSLGVLSMAQSKAPEVPTKREFFTVQYWSA